MKRFSLTSLHRLHGRCRHLSSIPVSATTASSSTPLSPVVPAVPYIPSLSVMRATPPLYRYESHKVAMKVAPVTRRQRFSTARSTPASSSVSSSSSATPTKRGHQADASSSSNKNRRTYSDSNSAGNNNQRAGHVKKKTTTTTKGQEKGSGKLGNVRPEGDREWGLMVNNHNRIDDLFRKGQDKAALALFDRLKGQRDGDNRSVLLRKTWHLILQKSARSEDAGNEATAKDLYRAYRDMCITDLQQQRQQHQRQQESSPPASVAAVDNMGEGYNIYMKRFSRSLKVDKVLSIFEDMKQDGVRPTTNTFRVLMNLFAQLGNVEQVLYYMDEMRSVNADVSLQEYNILIMAYGRVGDLYRIEKLFQEMSRRGIKPQVNTFNRIIDSFCIAAGRSDSSSDAGSYEKDAKLSASDSPSSSAAAAGEWVREAWITDMLSCLDIMKRNELTPNVVTYNTIIKALVNRPYTYASTDASSANSTHRNTASQSNQSGTEYTSKDGGIHTTNTGDVSTVTSSTATGVSAYRLSIIDHVYHTMSEEGVEPNSKTFNTMKRAFQQDPVRLARLQAERDQSFRIPPDAASFNIELHTLSKKEKFEDLLTVFDRMRREGVTPTVVTYNTMLNAFSRKGNVKKDRVLYLWTLMRTDGVTPDAFSYNAMLAMHNFTDDFDAAWGLYREMRGQGVQPDIVTYKVAIDACGWHRQIDKVAMVWEDLKHACDKGQVVANTLVYSALLDAYARNAQWSRCNQVVDSMNREGLYANARMCDAFCNFVQKYGMGRIIEQEGVATSNVHMLLADMIMQTDQ